MWHLGGLLNCTALFLFKWGAFNWVYPFADCMSYRGL